MKTQIEILSKPAIILEKKSISKNRLTNVECMIFRWKGMAMKREEDPIYTFFYKKVVYKKVILDWPKP